MTNRAFTTYSAEGNYKKVLVVCSAGILRSATAQYVLQQAPFDFNVRCAGTESYALVPVTYELLQWCDEVLCMQSMHESKLLTQLKYADLKRDVTCLYVPDDYNYRDPALVKELYDKCYDLFLKVTVHA